VQEVDAIIEELADATEITGPGFGDAGAPLKRHFDEHFAGSYLAMYKWLAFALKANFADFFEGTGSAAQFAAKLRAH
jgi:hypothetical protein